MQNRIARIRAANALSDVLIDLKVVLLQLEGVELRYKKQRLMSMDAELDESEGRWVTLEGGNKAFIDRAGAVKKGPKGLKGTKLPSKSNTKLITGSAAGSKKMFEELKSEKAKRMMSEARERNYYFSGTENEKRRNRMELTHELMKDGVNVTKHTHELHGDSYSVFSSKMSYQDISRAEQAINNSWFPVTSREDYIANCKEAGIKPKLHVVPEPIHESWMKATDGTPVYENIDAESVLSDEEIARHLFGTKKLKTANEKAFDSWTDEQEEAIRRYTSQYMLNNYSDINEFLSSGKKRNEETEQVAKLVTEALDHEIGADCIVYRGTNDLTYVAGGKKANAILRKIVRGDFSSAKELREMLVDQEVTSERVTSTSTERDLRTYGKLPVQIVFKTPANAKAVNINDASIFGSGANKAAAMFGVATQEKEVAFKPGMRYRIDAVEFSMSTFQKKPKGQIFIVATVLTEKTTKDRSIVRDAGKDEDGRWVTLDPSKTRVFIDEEGEVKKGPPSLAGKPLPRSTKSKSSGVEPANIETQSRTVSGTKIQAPKRVTSTRSPEERENKARAIRKTIEATGFSDDRTKRMEASLKDAPDEFVDAFTHGLTDAEIRLNEDSRAFYRPGPYGSLGTLHMSKLELNEDMRDAERELEVDKETAVAFHEIAHYLDAKYGITEMGNWKDQNSHTNDFGRRFSDFEYASWQDAKSFVEDIAGGKYGFDTENGVVYRKSDNASVGHGPFGEDRFRKFDVDGHSELLRDVSNHLNDLLGIKTEDQFKEEVGHPIRPDYDKYFEHYVTPKRQLYRRRERYKGAGEDYRKVMDSYYEKEDAFREANPDYFDKLRAFYDENERRKAMAAPFTDMIDSATGGQLGMFLFWGGHSGDYYHKNSDNKSHEMFANWLQTSLQQEPISGGLMARYAKNTSAFYKKAFSETAAVDKKYDAYERLTKEAERRKAAKKATTDSTPDDSEGRWVTLEGGTKVFIGKSGKVEKGPPALTGASLPKAGEGTIKPKKTVTSRKVAGQIRETPALKAWAKKSGLPQIEKGKSYHSATERRQRADKMVVRLKDGNVPPEIVQIVRNHIASAPESVEGIIASALSKTSIKTNNDSGPSYYMPGKREINLQLGNEKSNEEAAMTFMHEIGHSIDETWSVSRTLSNTGEFKEFAEKDAGKFISDSTDGEFTYKNGAICNAKTGERINNQEDMVFVQNSVTDRIRDILLDDDSRKYKENLMPPQRPNFDDFFEYYKKPNGFADTREKYPGAEVDYVRKNNEWREKDEAWTKRRKDPSNAREREMYDEYKKREEAVRFFSDSVCAMTEGTLNLKATLGGHSREYYMQDKSLGAGEIFANWFASISTGDVVNYGLMKKHLPSFVDVFERRILAR